jgi:threonine dehydratase
MARTSKTPGCWRARSRRRVGAYLVEDSLDLATCEGAATIGLELVRDDPELDVVLVALGGGAMASGVGYVVRSLADHVEVIGIQPVGAPAMALSWRQRTVVETDRIETIADGVAGRCPIPEVLDDLLVVLDDVMLVREDSIKAGMRMIYEHAGLVVEPSAALGVAAVLEEPERFAGRRVTTILCGSNVSPADFARWVLEPLTVRITPAAGRRAHPCNCPRRTAQDGAWDKPDRHPGSAVAPRGLSSPLYWTTSTSRTRRAGGSRTGGNHL